MVRVSKRLLKSRKIMPEPTNIREDKIVYQNEKIQMGEAQRKTNIDVNLGAATGLTQML